MSKVIALIDVDGIPHDRIREVVPTWTPGSYVVSIDHAAGCQSLVCTPDVHEALAFDNALLAIEYYRRVGEPAFRPDGMPNRPLTAFTVCIEDA